MAISACKRQSLVVALAEMGAKLANQSRDQAGKRRQPARHRRSGRPVQGHQSGRPRSWLVDEREMGPGMVLGGKRPASCHSASCSNASGDQELTCALTALNDVRRHLEVLYVTDVNAWDHGMIRDWS
jgi:hypothetical protein